MRLALRRAALWRPFIARRALQEALVWGIKKRQCAALQDARVWCIQRLKMACMQTT
jgi:hypothetical protein